MIISQDFSEFLIFLKYLIKKDGDYYFKVGHSLRGFRVITGLELVV